jgi:hypothetical protein
MTAWNMNQTTTIPDPAPWLVRFIEDSDDGIVKRLPMLIDGFRGIRQRMPEEYRWRLITDDAFAKHAFTDGDHVNQVYWYHIARQIEAFGVLAVLRTNEMLTAALTLLNEKHVLAPAVLARSLLEIAITYLVDGNYVDRTVKEMLARINANDIVACTDLEQRLAQMVHGRRIGDPPKELQKTNVLTHIKLLSRNPHCVELSDRYNYLCEIAHPNVVGFARFWGEAAESANDFITITVRGDNEVAQTAHIREQTLWAISWATESIGNMFFMGVDSVHALIGEFGIPPSEMRP